MGKLQSRRSRIGSGWQGLSHFQTQLCSRGWEHGTLLKVLPEKLLGYGWNLKGSAAIPTGATMESAKEARSLDWLEHSDAPSLVGELSQLSDALNGLRLLRRNTNAVLRESGEQREERKTRLIFSDGWRLGIAGCFRHGFNGCYR